MLTFVGEHYGHVFDETQQRFCRDFTTLSFTAQCLYVRLVNRKGALFARRSLRYPEIPDLATALQELEGAGFLGVPELEQLGDMLNFMTRAQLFAALKPLVPALRSSM